MPASEAQKRATKKYDKENAVFVGLKLNRKSDKDILDWLDGKSKQTVIKNAIRNEIKREQEQNKQDAKPGHEQ